MEKNGPVFIEQRCRAATFKDFPPIQKPDTFALDDALKAMSNAASGR